MDRNSLSSGTFASVPSPTDASAPAPETRGNYRASRLEVNSQLDFVFVSFGCGSVWLAGCNPPSLEERWITRLPTQLPTDRPTESLAEFNGSGKSLYLRRGNDDGNLAMRLTKTTETAATRVGDPDAT